MLVKMFEVRKKGRMNDRVSFYFVEHIVALKRASSLLDLKVAISGRDCFLLQDKICLSIMQTSNENGLYTWNDTWCRST